MARRSSTQEAHAQPRMRRRTAQRLPLAARRAVERRRSLGREPARGQQAPRGMLRARRHPRLPMADAAMDFVLAADVLGHVPSLHAADAAAASLLEPGGDLDVNAIHRTLHARLLAVGVAGGIGLVPRAPTMRVCSWGPTSFARALGSTAPCSRLRRAVPSMCRARSRAGRSRSGAAPRFPAATALCSERWRAHDPLAPQRLGTRLRPPGASHVRRCSARDGRRAALGHLAPASVARDLAPTSFALLGSLQVPVTFVPWSPTQIVLHETEGAAPRAWKSKFVAS